MSFLPFKKKPAKPLEDVATDAQVDTAQEDATDSAANIAHDSDRTDPLSDVIAEPSAELIRENNGVRLERVELRPGDAFMRLTVGDAARAEQLRELLLDLPEHSSGFRDLLVSEAAPLAAALELPERSLADLSSGTVDYYRPLDVLDALRSTAALLAEVQRRTKLVWPQPEAAQIGLTAQQAHPARGYRSWQASFTGWDGLAAGDEAAAARALVAACIPALDALLDRARETKFGYAHAPLALLLGRLSELEQSAASYAELAALDFGPELRCHAATDVGQRREHNEDAYALLNLEQASAAGVRFTLAAVADGMGGHNSGEVASTLALDLLRAQLSQLLLAPSTRHADTGRLPEQIEQIIPSIGRALNDRAALQPELAGMGTTLVGFAHAGPLSTLPDAGGRPAPTGAVFWVGDSRAYLLGPCGIAPLSVDHSYVQGLVDSGQVTAEEAFTHPQKNVITRCLGGSGQDDRPAVAVFIPGPGELILLCSDGLTDALRESEVWAVACAANSSELADIAAALIDSANAAGGPDNITVALLGS